jgi:hypothetical protein
MITFLLVLLLLLLLLLFSPVQWKATKWRKFSVLALCNHATLQRNNHAALHATEPSRNLATQQSRNLANLVYCAVQWKESKQD